MIVGCGYLGRRVARRWLAGGAQVAAVARSAARAAEFRGEGMEAIEADVAEPGTLAALPECETLVYAVGYDAKSGRSREAVQIEGLKSVLDALAGRCDRVLFVSTTGVYAQDDGGWVDETSPTEPETDGGRAALAAEAVLEAHPLGARSAVFRMAGLYGPGRVPRRESIVRGEPIATLANGYLNLIHADDAAAVLVLAAAAADVRGVYCVADGHPVVRRDYFAEVARLYGAPAPTFVEPPADAVKRGRGGTSKRVSNRRLMDTLAPKLAYPTYREGLAASVAEEA